MLNRLKTGLRALLRRSQAERELDEELREHIERQIEQNIRLGMNPEEASTAAHKAFGGVEQAKERSRDTRGVRRVEELWQDLSYGAHMLLKNPGFTLIAVITLALGIGANAAIFSVVNATLLRPLPYKESDRLVWLYSVYPQIKGDSHSPADFLDYQAQNRSFEQMAAFRTLSFTLTGEDRPERIDGRIVTANYFSLLGVEPGWGRNFTPKDGEAGAGRVILLSYNFWQRRFNGDPKAIGRALTLNGESATVIGVMPPAFKEDGLNLWVNPHRIVPDVATGSQQDLITVRNYNYLRVIARLKPGVTLPSAQTDINSISARLQQQYPKTNAVRNVQIVPLLERFVGALQPTLLILFGAVGLVLLIACANIANLMLVRATARQKEIAIRAALGADRRRILQQLLTESVLLASLSGICGWLLAIWGVDLIVSLSPANTPRLSEIRLDSQVLIFTLAVSLFTGLIFGLIPAMTASKFSLTETLKEGGRGAANGLSGHRARSLLVIAEVTIALVVITGAALLLRSFDKLQTVNPGFDPDKLTTLLVWMSEAKYLDPSISRGFIKELNDRLAALPGIDGVAISNDLPILGTDSRASFEIDGRAPAGDAVQIGRHAVGKGYFQAMRIPLRAGREFTEHDNEKAPQVVIINETAAQIMWPGEDPVGKRLKLHRQNWAEVIGVVGDVKHDGLHQPPFMHAYLSNLQFPWPVLRVALRSNLNQASLIISAQREVQAIDPNQPISNIMTMGEIIADSMGTRRLAMSLFSLFAALALLLTAIGLYGVMAYSVSQRTREMGIRIALGAQTGNVLRLVVKQGMILAAIGVVLGLITSFAMTRLMRTILYEVSATDPVTFIFAPLLIGVVALLACWIPARRAASVDPMVALRNE
jgi:putative ABC transport system permease protein